MGAYSNHLEQMKRTRRCLALSRKSWPARATSQPPVRHRVDARLDHQEIGRLLAEYRAGRSGRELAQKYGLARSTVIELLHKHGVAVRHPRVTASEQAEMADLYHSGVRQVDIAARFGRSKGAVWHVLKRAGAFDQIAQDASRRFPVPTSEVVGRQ